MVPSILLTMTFGSPSTPLMVMLVPLTCRDMLP